MNADPVAGDIRVVRLDASGRILSADEAILRLQRAAGGTPDGRIAVPQIAAVAHLARRLGILIARPLLVGGAERDIRLWVRARPTDEGMELHISEWQESFPTESGDNAALRAADVALSAEGADWRTDGQMRFLQTGAGFDFGAPGDEFFSNLADAGVGQPLTSAIAGRRPFFSLPALAKGQGRVIELSGHPLFDVDGSFLGYRGKAKPVDEHTADVREAIPEGKTVMAGPDIPALPDLGKRLDLALRQPLGRIIANAETISGQMEGPLRADYADYAADIADAGRHLMELVDDLADLQAIDRPGFKVASEDIDLADLARRAAGLLSMRAADRHIRVDAPATDEAMPAVGEFRRALQIIVNLLSNAIRYSPEQSIVWMRVDGDESKATLVVADQGHGIAIEDHERVFDKFERLGRDDVAGSGLGLYISRRLARAMKGDLTVESAPGQGARFVLSLPREATRV